MICIVVDRNPRGGLPPKVSLGNGLEGGLRFLIIHRTDFKPNSVARLEEIARRKDFYIKFVNFIGCQRFPLSMCVEWLPGLRFIRINRPL